jgi:biotin operon repressor
MVGSLRLLVVRENIERRKMTEYEQFKLLEQIKAIGFQIEKLTHQQYLLAVQLQKATQK